MIAAVSDKTPIISNPIQPVSEIPRFDVLLCIKFKFAES